MAADETFEARLFGPYQDAFPPPGHVHPGHLVVNKPDLGPEHWAAAAAAVGGPAECRCGGGGGPRCGGHRGAAEQGPCRCDGVQNADVVHASFLTVNTLLGSKHRSSTNEQLECTALPPPQAVRQGGGAALL